MKSKYSTNRKFIRMSWNKYNLFNITRYYKYNNYQHKKRLKIRSLIYKNKLLAKQRLRRYYGNISEIELKKLLRLAAWYRNKFYKRYTNKPIQDYLLINLERRLDTALFRIHWVPSIFASRQLISHGHILVNGKKISSCGYILSANDLIQINKKSIDFIKKLNNNYKNSFFKSKLNKFKNISIFKILPKPPRHFIINSKNWSAIFLYMPNIKKIKYPFNVKSYLVNRFYKKVRY